MTIKLLKQLRKLQRAMAEQTYDVNLGGCGVFAGLLATEMQALGIDCEVITKGAANLSPKQARHYLSAHLGPVPRCAGEKPMHEWASYGVNFTHLAVRFRWNGRVYTVDSEELSRGSEYFGDVGYICRYPFGFGFTPKEALGTAMRKQGWNTKFDRDHIPLIRHLVQRYIGYWWIK